MLGLMAHGRSCFFNLLVLLFMLLYLLLENSKLKRLHRGPVLFKLQYNTGMSNTTTARPIQFHLLSPVKLSFCVSVTKFNHTFKTWDVLVKEQEVQNFKKTAKKKVAKKVLVAYHQFGVFLAPGPYVWGCGSCFPGLQVCSLCPTLPARTVRVCFGPAGLCHSHPTRDEKGRGRVMWPLPPLLVRHSEMLRARLSVRFIPCARTDASSLSPSLAKLVRLFSSSLLLLLLKKS